jgi:hypothetical protein
MCGDESLEKIMIEMGAGLVLVVMTGVFAGGTLFGFALGYIIYVWQ